MRAQKDDVLLQPQLADEVQGRLPIRAVSDEEQPGGQLAVNPLKDLDDLADALHLTEVRQMAYEDLVVTGEVRAHAIAAVTRGEAFRIDEVVDDAYFAVDAKVLTGLLGEVRRNRGHTVALQQAKASDLEERLIEAQEVDVGPVQGRHDFRGVISDDLATQIRADGVRNRVVSVKNVDASLATGHGQLRRQRECVGWILEQGIRRDLDLVKVDARRVGRHADRPQVAEQMDDMPALGESEPELCRYHPASPEGRVADDTEAQRFLHGSLSKRFTRSVTGSGDSQV